MNLILLFPEDFISETSIRLAGRRLEHIRSIHRASVGAQLCVGIAGGRIGTGTVTSLDQTFLEMEAHLEDQPPVPISLTLLLALPRPKIFRRVMRSVTALGVKRIILFNSFRVEKSYWQSPLLEKDALREQLILGLEQAKDTIFPEVLFRPLFKPFVEDELPDLVKGSRAFVAHPSASTPCPVNVKDPVTLAIGPEGGFIPYEIEKLKKCGFTPIQMGSRILSVETAVPALIARIAL
ncbi:MAG: 16S rRNA (uracil(1498)-N(3))-methyltransferase [Nitrospirota bacterium]